jgi:hypothetical protein
LGSDRIYVSDFTRGVLFESGDGGATWRRMATEGLVSERIWALGFDQSLPKRLWAATVAGGLQILGASESGGTDGAAGAEARSGGGQ